MMRMILTTAVYCASMAADAAPSMPVPLVNLGEIHGAALGWIRIAMPVFEQQVNGDIKTYAISIQEAGDIVHVVFQKTPVLRGQRGAAREGPGLEVEISKTSGTVVNARVIR